MSRMAEEHHAAPISEEEWARFRAEATQSLPAALVGRDLPDILIDYQKELLRATADHQVVIVDKSRRIGATWGVGADAVLTSGAAKSAGGMDTLYIGYNLDMAREFIDTCAMWARAFMPACTEVSEFLFKDKDERGADRAIQAFRISFASGFEIVALSSKPRSLRGRQGYVILDEFAFHDDAEGLLKAAMALLIWGGKILIISTHNGVESVYNQVIQETLAGRKPYHIVRVTFDDALEQGLYQRICLVTGKEWSPDAEARWRSAIRAFYGDDAAEELDCIPKESGGRYLSRTLIEARMADDIPILRWKPPEGFVDWGKELREAECRDWCEEHLKPLLTGLSKDVRSAIGEDFARRMDLTVFWPLLIMPTLRRLTPFIIELRDTPFEQQAQIFFYVCDRLPAFSSGALDAGGNGMYLAEVARQRYGPDTIEEILLSEGWYREAMPKLKAALEDDDIDLPRHQTILDDFMAIEMVRGVPRVVDKRGSDATGKRHGDSAIAAALAWYATNRDYAPIEFKALGRPRASRNIAGFMGP